MSKNENKNLKKDNLNEELNENANEELKNDEASDCVNENNETQNEDKCQGGDEEETENVKQEEDNAENDDEKKDNNNQENKDETDWKNKYVRLLAEFDNFRKRTEKEKESLIGFGSSIILGKFLPLIDNMDRAHEALTEDDKKTSMGEGLDKIYKQLEKLLEELDVKPIEAVGKPFDPELHNAVMTDEESDAEVDTVTQELQKGYTYKGDVLRHTMVKVKK